MKFPPAVVGVLVGVGEASKKSLILEVSVIT